MRTLSWRFIPFVVFVLLVCFFWRGLSLDPHTLPSVQVGKALPQFHLPQLEDDRLQFSPRELHGQIVLLNVWASWCYACTEEQIFLMQLAQEGFSIYGLNYKDSPEDAMNWLKEWGNPYKVVGKDIDGKVAIDIGAYGTPETFLIDQKGVIRYRHIGILNAKIWQQEFLPRINQLKSVA